MRQIRVKIFDDDPANLKLFTTVMAMRDYEVYASERAVPCPISMNHAEVCTSLKPCADIILTDNQMPGMTGIEMLLEQARQGCRIDVRNKAIVSADYDADQLKIVEGLGCAVFNKPCRLSEIFAWLDDCETRVDLSTSLGTIRKGVRHPAEFEMVYATDADDRFHKGTVLNYSQSGLCVRTDVPLGQQQSIVICSDIPNGCRSASVRWVNKTSDQSYLAGLECR